MNKIKDIYILVYAQCPVIGNSIPTAKNTKRNEIYGNHFYSFKIERKLECNTYKKCIKYWPLLIAGLSIFVSTRTHKKLWFSHTENGVIVFCIFYQM